jgi:hypothetical protein
MAGGDLGSVFKNADDYSMKFKSRNDMLSCRRSSTRDRVERSDQPCPGAGLIARDPGVRLRDIGDRVGITERAAHRSVVELADAGYITRRRNGRRNHYTINADLPLPDHRHASRTSGSCSRSSPQPTSPTSGAIARERLRGRRIDARAAEGGSVRVRARRG